MRCEESKMRTFGLVHLKVHAHAVVSVVSDGSNSGVVVAACNDACACNDKTMVRTDPLITAIGIQDFSSISFTT